MSKFSEKTTKAKTGLKRFLRNLLILAVILFIGVMFFLYYGTYSTGVRAGVVLKISKKGALFKTYEGQLDVLNFGAVKSDNQLSQTFEFSVEKNNDSLIDVLEKKSLTGERIQVRYEEKYAVLPWRGDTKYFVTEIEDVENDGKRPDRGGSTQGDNYLE